METNEEFQAILGIDYLMPTNQSLNQGYVDHLVTLINNGDLNPEEKAYLFVRVEMNEGYYINDGNHHLEAFRIAGVRAALVKLYSLKESAINF